MFNNDNKSLFVLLTCFIFAIYDRRAFLSILNCYNSVSDPRQIYTCLKC